MHRLMLRNGNVSIRNVPVRADDLIHAGDLIYLAGEVARPASQFQMLDMAGSLVEFAKQFLGVAHRASYAGSTTPIPVDVSPWSVYEFQVGRLDYRLGDNLGPLMHANPLQFDNQTLFHVAHPEWAIARAAEFKSGSNLLLVTFASRFTTGSSRVA